MCSSPLRSLFLFVLLATPLAAPAQTITFDGSIRERTELSAKSSSGSRIDAFHLLRTRFGASASISANLSATLQFQDARYFGQEGSPSNGTASSIDFHQAYVELRQILDAPISARLGRMELSFGNERLIGKADWGNAGQAFDGILVTATPGNFRFDLFADAITRNAAPSGTRDIYMTGLWSAWSPDSGRTSLQGYYIFDNPRDRQSMQNRNTVGIYTKGATGGFDAELDAAAQFGRYHDRFGDGDISASMVGARLGYTFEHLAQLRIGLGYDRLSGNTSDSRTQGEFSTLYASNHKFYGLIDYFPMSSGLGLVDALATASLPIKDFNIGMELHFFSTAADPDDLGYSGAASAIGEELDATVGYRAMRGWTLGGGVAVFNGADNRAVLTGRTPTEWGYVTTTVSF